MIYSQKLILFLFILHKTGYNKLNIQGVYARRKTTQERKKKYKTQIESIPFF